MGRNHFASISPPSSTGEAQLEQVLLEPSVQTSPTWNMEQTSPTILEDNNGFVSVRLQVSCHKA